MPDATTIRDATPDDGSALAAIYNYYIEHTIITFETELVTAPIMADRIEQTTRTHPWLILIGGGQPIGYAYATRWSPRAAYSQTAETTVYLSPDHVGQGHGKTLFRALLDRLRAQSIHTALAGIALPNDASVALHERLGFQKVAHFLETGRKFDRWIDVAYWQLVLSADSGLSKSNFGSP